MRQEPTLYRFFEVLPGALAWLTLILMVVLSRRTPAFVAVFIILFDIYWLLKTIYLSFHLRETFSGMRANMKIDWLARLKKERLPFEQMYHLVIFPFSREPYEVVRESFEGLAAANYPLQKFLVVLAAEEWMGEEAQEVARRVEKDFGSRFFRFLRTTHPAGLPGEIRGKGSNDSWAAKEAKRLLIDPLNLPYENVMVSIFDADTRVCTEYFGRLTYVFLKAERRLRAIYQPIPMYTNNIYQAPAFARVVAFSATFWQMMQQSRPERLTAFSSQSLPLTVVLDVGYWERNIVSEDSRVFWQGYLRYHGDFRVEPLTVPVYMDANVAPTFLATMKNVYKQQRRWAWGVENTPYLLSGFLRDPQIPKPKKRYWTFVDLEGRWSWATNSLLIFALGWLPTLIGAGAFQTTLLSYSLPQITRFIIQLSMIGIATSAILGILLLPPRQKGFRFYHYGLYALQWLLIPVTLTVFGAIPALEAQTRLMLGGKFRLGFWVTPKHRLPHRAV